jgi:hypothetical protein
MLADAARPLVYLVAFHGASADHFSQFAKKLVEYGCEVQFFAAGDAFKKLESQHSQSLNSFSNSQDELIRIARRCAEAAVVITDVGHESDIALQEALSQYAPATYRIAYYENPEPYVPGGYSRVAARVMPLAHRVLLANSNLAIQPLYQEPGHEVPLKPEQKFGLGYYPLEPAKVVAAKRADRAEQRSEWEALHNVQGRRIFVYAGGNNEVYFSAAFPAFLRFLSELTEREELADCVILLQQHPGAKAKNIDGEMIRQWVDHYASNPRAPRIIISDLSSEQAQILADGILYYQTSMAPQFVLAGIPTIQVGHDVYEDLLVRNDLCSVATDAESLLRALKGIGKNAQDVVDEGKVKRGLGYLPDWPERLRSAVERS